MAEIKLTSRMIREAAHALKDYRVVREAMIDEYAQTVGVCYTERGGWVRLDYGALMVLLEAGGYEMEAADKAILDRYLQRASLWSLVNRRITSWTEFCDIVVLVVAVAQYRLGWRR